MIENVGFESKERDKALEEKIKDKEISNPQENKEAE